MGGKTADTRYKLQIILIITIQYIYDHDTLMTVTSLIVQRDRNVPPGTHHYTQVYLCVYVCIYRAVQELHQQHHKQL